MRTAAVLAVVASLVAGCRTVATRGPVAEPLDRSASEVFVYLEPLSAEAAGLRLEMGTVAAVSAGGTLSPLDARTPVIAREDSGRQRLFAWGRLAPGAYTGLAIQVLKATVAAVEGSAALLVPAEPLRVEAGFTAYPGQSVVLWLSLEPGSHPTGSFELSPAFTARLAPRLLLERSAYCSIEGMASLAVFDKVAGKVAWVYPAGRLPEGMALDPLLRRLYVALSGDDEVQVIDLDAGATVARIRLQPGDHPREIALTPDGRLLVSINAGSNTASFIDTAAAAELRRARTGLDPGALLVDRLGRRAYVFNRGANSITVLDIPARAALFTRATEGVPVRGQLNRDGTRLFVIQAASPFAVVLSVPDLSQVGRYFVGFGATALKIDPRTDFVYVGVRGESRLQLYVPPSFLPMDALDLPGDASYLAIDGDQNLLLAVIPSLQVVVAVDLTSKRVRYVVDVGTDPYEVTTSAERN